MEREKPGIHPGMHLITPALCQALNWAVGESDSPGPLDAHHGGDRQGAHRRSPIFNFTLVSHPISCRFQFQDGSQPPTRKVPWVQTT